MNTRRAFTLVEVMIALALVIFGFFTFFSVFSSSAHHATQSRNRAVATMLAQNYLEEIEAHPYGADPPQSWTEKTDVPVKLWIQGRQQHHIFEKEFKFDTQGFIGKSNEQQDVVTVIIRWKEGVGDDEVAGDQEKEISVQVPVWRGQ